MKEFSKDDIPFTHTGSLDFCQDSLRFSKQGLNVKILSWTLTQALQALKDRTCGVRELISAYAAAVERIRPLNLYVTETLESAMMQAEESQRRYDAGCPRPLEGIPVGIKDVFCTKGVRTTAGSRMLENFIPPYESTVSQRLKDAGAIMLGKLNMDEFCMGSSTTSEFTGAALNPWDPTCTTGGSSGGSAAALPCAGALATLGTDTGGSIRQPAAFCGSVGLKPTYGRCSRWGIVAFSSSLDSPGPLTRNVLDNATVFQVLAGHDPKDSTSSTAPVPEYLPFVGAPVHGLRVGIPTDLCPEDHMDPQVLDCWKKAQNFLQGQGCTLVPISLPHCVFALHIYYVIACAEAASNLMRYDGIRYGYRSATKGPDGHTLEALYRKSRGEGFGSEVKRRIFMGTYVLSAGYHEAYYEKAKKVRQCVIEDFQCAFEKVDVLLTPTAPTPAFSFSSIDQQDPVKMYLNDAFTVPVNIGQCCAMSLPGGLSSQGLPIGLQFIAPAFQEGRLFQFGAALEAMMPMGLCIGGAL